MSIIYIPEDRLKLCFLNFVINVDSLNQKFGSLEDFSTLYPYQGRTDGKILILTSINFVRQLESKMLAFMAKHNLEEFKDYVYVEDTVTLEVDSEFVRQSIGNPIKVLSNCNWLDSIVLKEGHYVWFRKSEY